jgi:hypothetical protein
VSLPPTSSRLALQPEWCRVQLVHGHVSPAQSAPLPYA